MKPPEPPVLYRRKYKDDNKEVSIKDLRDAYHRAARMVADRGDQYLPLFERLEQEIKDRQNKDATKARAIEVAKKAAARKGETPR